MEMETNKIGKELMVLPQFETVIMPHMFTKMQFSEAEGKRSSFSMRPRCEGDTPDILANSRSVSGIETLCCLISSPRLILFSIN